MSDWLKKAQEEGGLNVDTDAIRQETAPETQQAVTLEDIVNSENPAGKEIGAAYRWLQEIQEVQSVMPQVIEGIEDRLKNEFNLSIDQVNEIKILLEELIRQA